MIVSFFRLTVQLTELRAVNRPAPWTRLRSNIFSCSMNRLSRKEEPRKTTTTVTHEVRCRFVVSFDRSIRISNVGREPRETTTFNKFDRSSSRSNERSILIILFSRTRLSDISNLSWKLLVDIRLVDRPDCLLSSVLSDEATSFSSKKTSIESDRLDEKTNEQHRFDLARQGLDRWEPIRSNRWSFFCFLFDSAGQRRSKTTRSSFLRLSEKPSRTFRWPVYFCSLVRRDLVESSVEQWKRISQRSTHPRKTNVQVRFVPVRLSLWTIERRFSSFNQRFVETSRWTTWTNQVCLASSEFSFDSMFRLHVKRLRWNSQCQMVETSRQQSQRGETNQVKSSVFSRWSTNRFGPTNFLSKERLNDENLHENWRPRHIGFACFWPKPLA